MDVNEKKIQNYTNLFGYQKLDQIYSDHILRSKPHL